MAKEHITPTDLFVLLDREFRKRKPGQCDTCFVSLPFPLKSEASSVADWDVAPIGECPHSCRIVLDDLVENFRKKFRLAA